VQGLGFTASQDQNLALTVLHEPCSLDSGAGPWCVSGSVLIREIQVLIKEIQAPLETIRELTKYLLWTGRSGGLGRTAAHTVGKFEVVRSRARRLLRAVDLPVQVALRTNREGLVNFRISQLTPGRSAYE